MAGKVFDRVCPFCRLSVDAGLSNGLVPWSLRCPCGAIALGSPRPKDVIDAMIKHYDISPSSEEYGDFHASTAWTRDFHIDTRDGGRSVEMPDSVIVHWRWFLRKLPWEKPAGPMTDRENLEWLTKQAEKFYDLMYDSRRPGNEYREAKEAFEDAIALAWKMGLGDEAARLEKRLSHIKAVYTKQFSGF
ncbi:MAG: hypothetical protein HZB91_03390 [Elusimicrobia bacterium]|nr:hypothetical protein [Elusimicrobiota bacterium]